MPPNRSTKRGRPPGRKNKTPTYYHLVGHQFPSTNPTGLFEGPVGGPIGGSVGELVGGLIGVPSIPFSGHQQHPIANLSNGNYAATSFAAGNPDNFTTPSPQHTLGYSHQRHSAPPLAAPSSRPIYTITSSGGSGTTNCHLLRMKMMLEVLQPNLRAECITRCFYIIRDFMAHRTGNPLPEVSTASIYLPATTFALAPTVNDTFAPVQVPALVSTVNYTSAPALAPASVPTVNYTSAPALAPAPVPIVNYTSAPALASAPVPTVDHTSAPALAPDPAPTFAAANAATVFSRSAPAQIQQPFGSHLNTAATFVVSPQAQGVIECQEPSPPLMPTPVDTAAAAAAAAAAISTLPVAEKRREDPPIEAEEAVPAEEEYEHNFQIWLDKLWATVPPSFEPLPQEEMGAEAYGDQRIGLSVDQANEAPLEPINPCGSPEIDMMECLQPLVKFNNDFGMA